MYHGIEKSGWVVVISYLSKKNTEVQAVYKSSKKKKLIEIFAALRLSVKITSLLMLSLNLSEQLFSVIDKNFLMGAQ